MDDFWDRYDNDLGALDDVYEREFGKELSSPDHDYDKDDDDPLYQLNHQQQLNSQTQLSKEFFSNLQTYTHSQKHLQNQIHPHSQTQAQLQTQVQSHNLQLNTQIQLTQQLNLDSQARSQSKTHSQSFPYTQLPIQESNNDQQVQNQQIKSQSKNFKSKLQFLSKQIGMVNQKTALAVGAALLFGIISIILLHSKQLLLFMIRLRRYFSEELHQ